jgi:hypothetical protein
VKEFLRLYREAGGGNIEYFSPPNSAGSGLANNGLSVSGGVIQLGGLSGSAAAATLLNNREIPTAGFQTSFSGTGKLLIGSTATDTTDSQLQVFNNVSISNPNGLTILRFNTTSAEGFFNFQGGTGLQQMAVCRNTRAFTAFGANAGGGVSAVGVSNSPQSTTAFGFFALANMSGGLTSQNSSAFGTNALRTMTSAVNNNAFGLNCLEQLTTGQENCCMGYSAGFVSLTDNQNCLFGNNVMVTTGASTNGNGATGSGNVMMGYSAGNVLGGIYAGVTTVFTNCIIFGKLSGVNTEGTTLSNTTLIGNSIFTNVSNVVMIGGNATAQNIMIAAGNNQADLGSRLQVFGAMSLPINSFAVTTTITNAMFTVIFTATSTATLPTAASSTNRIYCIVAQGAAVVTTSINFTNLAGASVNTVAAGTSVFIQSNGANWIQIN